MNHLLFLSRSRPDTTWVSAGLASTFPDLGDDMGSLVEARRCNSNSNSNNNSNDGHVRRPGCKVFRVPRDDPSRYEEIAIADDGLEEGQSSGDELLNQVVVFRYRGRFHAVDHRCPHAAYPLSNGMPFDIEDFGVRLSAGLTCPKHGWSFDLFTGMADTGRYKLPVWEVQLRDGAGVEAVDPSSSRGNAEEQTVWIRRKQRMG
ncbi:hypothetical protein E4U41_003346 [Claviceps citrina]|nr:hypothetical protein E4U41_003346 [Claviceps citrina]